MLEPILNLVYEIDGFHEINRLLLLLQLDCITLGQEGIEAKDELRVPVEECLDTNNDSVGINPLTLEIAHDLEELLVFLPLVLELILDGLEVEKRVIGGELLVLGGPLPLLRGGGRGRGRRHGRRIGSGEVRTLEVLRRRGRCLHHPPIHRPRQTDSLMATAAWICPTANPNFYPPPNYSYTSILARVEDRSPFSLPSFLAC